MAVDGHWRWLLVVGDDSGCRRLLLVIDDRGSWWLYWSRLIVPVVISIGRRWLLVVSDGGC